MKPTFTVAGEEALLGTAWDINAEDNDMEEVDEWKYELTLSDVPLYAGTYAYKVVKNHSWDTNYGDIETGDQDGNALLTIDEPAYYNVTFSFDYTTLAVSAVATKSKDAEQFVATFVNMPGWETVNAYAWNGEGDAAEQLNGAWPGEAAVKADANFSVPAYSSDFDVYTKTYYFAAPEKIIFNNGNGAQTNDIAFAEKVPFSQHGNGSNVVLFNDGSDQFKAEVEYVPATGTLATYARKFNVGTKQTVVLPFDLPADRIDAAGKFYTPLKIANDQITFTPATEVKANVPYLFEPATEFPFESVEVSAIPVFEQQSVEVGTGEFIYVTETTEVTSDAETTYYGFEGGVFKKAANGVANPWRGYFALPTADATAAKLDIVFDDTTGIEGVETVAADAENTKIYNLQGQQLSKIAGKGVFIVNGKKVLVTK